MLDNSKLKKYLLNTNLPDVQNESSSVNVFAGISNFKTTFNGNSVTLLLNFTITTSTQNTRGVHMSRLIKSTLNYMSGEYIEHSLLKIYDEITQTQPNCNINVKFQYPVRDQFLDTSITLDSKKVFHYVFKLTGITSCPCSKTITGIGHMQRTILTVELKQNDLINFEEVSLNLNECFSAPLVEFLSRADEANMITETQANSKFVEDVVRDCLKRFPQAKHIHARSFESIHSHDAIASWSTNNA